MKSIEKAFGYNGDEPGQLHRQNAGGPLPYPTRQSRITHSICNIMRAAAAAIAKPAAFGTNAMLAGGCLPFSLGL